MELFKEVIFPSVYEYAQVFLYLPCIIIVIKCLAKKVIKNVNKLLLKYVILFCIGAVSFKGATIITEQSFVKDDVLIVYDREADVVIEGVEYGKYYYEIEPKVINTRGLISIPVAFNRELYVYSQQSGNVELSINDTKNIYTMEDNQNHKLYIYSSSKFIKILFEVIIKAIVISLSTILNVFVIRYIFILTEYVYTRCKRKYEILFAAYLIVLFILYNPGKVNDWGAAWYSLNYKDGVGSRLFIGTILNLLCGYEVSSYDAYIFASIILIILCIIIAIMLGALIKSGSNDNRNALSFIVISYLACPGSIAYLWTEGNMGRLETYSLFFFLCAVIIFEKNKNIYIKYFSLFIFSVLAIISYQGCIFIYYQIIFTVIVCDLCSSYSKKNIFLSIINFIIVGITFMVMQGCSKLNYSTAQEAIEILEKRTDLHITYDAILYEYYKSVIDNFAYFQVYFLKHYDVEKKIVMAGIIFLPLVIMLIVIWRNVYHLSVKDKKWYYSEIFYILLANAMYIPIFVLMCDWGRWAGAFIGVQFFEICYLIYKKNESMQIIIKNIQIWITKHYILAMMILVYLASIEKIDTIFSAMFFK